MNKIAIVLLIIILICHISRDTHENLTCRKKIDNPYYTLDENKNIILIPRTIGTGIQPPSDQIPDDSGNHCKQISNKQYGLLKFGQIIDKDMNIENRMDDIPRVYHSGRSGPLSLDGIKCRLQTYTPVTEADNKAAARNNMDMYMPNNGRPGLPSSGSGGGGPVFGDPAGYARSADPSAFMATDGTLSPPTLPYRPAPNPLPPEKILPRTGAGDGNICSKVNSFDGQTFTADAFSADLTNLEDVNVKIKLLL